MLICPSDGPRQIDCGDLPDQQNPQPCPLAIAEQAPRDPAASTWDSDLDGCTDRQELRASQAQGGLRDPYNRWDFMDQWVNKLRDRRVDIIDIGSTVAQFGHTCTA